VTRVRRRAVLLAVGVAGLSGWLPGAVQAGPQPAAGPAYIVLAVPSARVVAQSRPDVLSAAMAPGSLMKVVTLVAALESGAADTDTRIVCRRTADLDGRPAPCVHPDFHRGLSAEEALGHSCNVYFATLARRLSRDALDAVLVRSGLPPTDPSVPLARAALGIDGTRATPRRWLDAFLRLTGTVEPGVAMRKTTRAVVRRGLALAGRSGTAEALWRAGYSALAKTGTAPMPGGGYVGLATAVVDAASPTHAIVVIAPGTSGAHAAGLAVQVLDGLGVPRPRAATDRQEPASAAPTGQPLRIGSAVSGAAWTLTNVDVEEVVARAVAGEGGDALPSAAREALAIATRSYALRNAGRHATEGFDLCDLTHCMVQRPATAASRAAATSTRGRILLLNGQPADVYFSASCGGHTERPSAVWPGSADPPHLPARPDPVCQRDTPWISEVAEPQLLGVLRALGHKGHAVSRLAVADRTTSGRAATLDVGGVFPERVDAETFRREAGRRLGWQVLKSSLYNVARTGIGYRFVGRGHGHGVGLCVRGAATRAATGVDAVAILGTYFPGTSVGAAPAAPLDVRVTLPEADRHQLPAVRAMTVASVRDLATRLGVDPPQRLDIVFHPTVEAYTRATGLPWWTAGRTRGTRIDLLPLAALRRRSLVDTTIPHEVVHVLTDAALEGRPLWVREGLAQVLAGEVGRPAPARSASMPCPSDDDLRRGTSPPAWRDAYAAAAACVAAALARDPDWRNLR